MIPETKCSRCRKKTDSTIMSRFNTDMICMECDEEEQKHPDYAWAVLKEHAEVLKGNLNYPGVGWPGTNGRVRR